MPIQLLRLTPSRRAASDVLPSHAASAWRIASRCERIERCDGIARGRDDGCALHILATQRFGQQLDTDWKHTQLIIDVVNGRGGMFSLENGEGVRFLTRSRLFDDDEVEWLKAQGRFGS